jgi:hypothetical protein
LKERNFSDVNKDNRKSSQNAKDNEDEYPYLTCPNGAWLQSVKTIKVSKNENEEEDMRCIVCNSGLRFCHRNSNSNFKNDTELSETVHLECNTLGCLGIATNRTGKFCGYNFTAGANVIKLFGAHNLQAAR